MSVPESETPYGLSAPAEELIEGPTEAPLESKEPKWFEELPAPPTTTTQVDEGADILVFLIVELHEHAATVTHYDKFRLSEREQHQWQKLSSYLLKKFPSKDWPIVLMVVFIAVSEVTKIGGFLSERGKLKNAEELAKTHGREVPDFR